MPAWVSDVLPPDAPSRRPATIAPPVWDTMASAFSVRPVAAVSVPAVWVMVPGEEVGDPVVWLKTGPFRAVRLTSGAVTEPDSVSGPLLARVIEAPSVTGPVTVSGCAVPGAWTSLRLKPEPEANGPIVAMPFG